MCNPIGQKTRDYLISRGYSYSLLKQEEIFELEDGRFTEEGIHAWVETPSAVFKARSLSGALTSIHVAGIDVKDYRTYSDPLHGYRAVFYASRSDLEILWQTKQVVMTEGVFDRIAIKRAFPQRAVFARLSKGIPPPLATMLRRLASRVWIAYDMDIPGESGAEKAKKVLRDVEVIRLQFPAKDPGDLFKSGGVKKVERAFERQFRAFDL